MSNAMQSLVGLAIGALILVTIIMLAPVIGGNVESAMPELAADSNWNETHNTDLPNGVDLWEIVGGLLVLIVVILFITVVLRYLMSIGQ